MALLVIACCANARAAEPVSDAPLFDSPELLEIRLLGPVSETISDRKKREERDFVLAHAGIEQPVRVRVRGKSRSRRDVCMFPPLRLHFDDARGTFAGQHKIKVVTHCQNSDTGDANVMEEYLAYRILNLLTPDSFRVRPLRITYADTDDRLSKRARLRYGFLLESTDELEARRGGKFIETAQLSLGQLDSEHAAIVYVFQYLIGNTDWSLVTADGETECCHNGRPLEVGDRIHYVPYDFDMAGIVNASYAKPDPGLRLRNVRVRRYRGFCTDRDILRGALRTVMRSEQDIYELARTTPGLDEKKQKSVLAYLAKFFNEARDEGAQLAAFEKRCLHGSG